MRVYVCVRVCSYVLLEDEAGQQGGGLFHRQIVEEAVENHLCEQELVSTGEINTQSSSLVTSPLILQPWEDLLFPEPTPG